ncbi:hypothetical protein LSAT2_001588 [Lamellibrachia satsuma]|nr:hypothetical protein LSAT2_001588 [Lamellibrachia satsuma]
MHQKAIRKPFEKFKVVKLPLALSKREARRRAQCYNCGESRHRSSQGCPAGASTCRNCGAMGHWAKAKACHRKLPSRESSRSRYISKSRDGYNHRGRYRGTRQSRGSRGWHSYGDGRKASMQFYRFKVKTQEESFAKVAYHAVNITVGAFEKVSAHASVELQLPNKQVYDTLKLKLDSGAEGNFLPLRTYKRMFPRNLNASGYPKSTQLTQSPEVTLTAYNGGEIKQHGAISLRCRRLVAPARRQARPPIQLDVRVNLVQFSQDRVKQLREETARDPVLAPLRDILVSGWPDTERELPKVLKPYWSYRDELSIDDGVILKGSEQVLVPAAMQQYVLTALYAGHQGRDKCRLRGKGSVYWKGMAADIEALPCCQLLCMPTTCTFSAERAFAAKERTANTINLAELDGSCRIRRFSQNFTGFAVSSPCCPLRRLVISGSSSNFHFSFVVLWLGSSIDSYINSCQDLRKRLRAKIEMLQARRKNLTRDSGVEKKRLARKVSKMKLKLRRKTEKQNKVKREAPAMKAATPTKKPCHKANFQQGGKKEKKGSDVLTGKNYKKLLEKVEKRKEKLTKVREMDGCGVARTLQKKQQWKSVLQKAEGVKVRDDPELLRKSLKKKEKLREKHSKEWKERLERVQKTKKEQQDKRKRNIQKKKHSRIDKKINRSKKKGHIILGF